MICPVFYLINWTFLLYLFFNDSMKTTDYIAHTINRLPKGYVFTYDDFYNEVNNKEAIIKELNRMAG